MRWQKLWIKEAGIIQNMTGDGGCGSRRNVWESVGGLGGVNAPSKWAEQEGGEKSEGERNVQ